MFKVQSTKYKALRGLLRHPIDNLNLPSDNLLLRFFYLLNHFRRHEILVVLVHGIADAVFIQSINVEPGLKLSLDHVLDD